MKEIEKRLSNLGLSKDAMKSALEKISGHHGKKYFILSVDHISHVWFFGTNKETFINRVCKYWRDKNLTLAYFNGKMLSGISKRDFERIFNAA